MYIVHNNTIFTHISALETEICKLGFTATTVQKCEMKIENLPKSQTLLPCLVCLDPKQQACSANVGNKFSESQFENSNISNNPNFRETNYLLPEY